MTTIIINDDGSITINGKVVVEPEFNAKMTMADFAEEYLGNREWDDTLRNIQKWFYGKVLLLPWCATFASYMASLSNVTEQVGKFDNVDLMKSHLNKQGRLDCTKNYGGGAYVPKRGDLVFFSAKHTYSDCTHVAIVTAFDNSTGKFEYIGGNQSNAVTMKTDNVSNLYVVAFGNITY